MPAASWNRCRKISRHQLDRCFLEILCGSSRIHGVWGFPKLGVTLYGVRICKRILLFGVYIWGPLLSQTPLWQDDFHEPERIMICAVIERMARRAGGPAKVNVLTKAGLAPAFPSICTFFCSLCVERERQRGNMILCVNSKYTNKRVYIYIYTYIYMCICVYIYICIYVCICIRTYIYRSVRDMTSSRSFCLHKESGKWS